MPGNANSVSCPREPVTKEEAWKPSRTGGREVGRMGSGQPWVGSGQAAGKGQWAALLLKSMPVSWVTCDLSVVVSQPQTPSLRQACLSDEELTAPAGRSRAPVTHTQSLPWKLEPSKARTLHRGLVTDPQRAKQL